MSTTALTALTARRNVYPMKEIPHLWAHGLPASRKIRGGNVFAEGGTIYSYGYHFPMAQRIALRSGIVVVLVNPWNYSVSTGNHQAEVRQAISGVADHIFRLHPRDRYNTNLWDIITNRRGSSKPLANNYQDRIDEWIIDAGRPRIRAATRQASMDQAATVLAEWRELHALFKLRLSVDSVSIVGLDEVKARYAKVTVAYVRRVKAQQAARAKIEAERIARATELSKLVEANALPAWRRGARITETNPATHSILRMRDLAYPALRITQCGGDIETSIGARIPTEEARTGLRLADRLLTRLAESEGSEGVTNDLKSDESIGGYSRIRVTREEFIIGCHSIPWREIRAFCAFYDWDIPASIPA